MDEGTLALLPAKRLLAYRNRLLGLEESPELSDWDRAKIESLDPDYIWFKSDPKWDALYARVIERLGELENVE